VLSAVQYNVSRRRKVFALFVGLSKAFDSVRHDKLWAKLYSMLLLYTPYFVNYTIGIRSKFIKIAQALYGNAKAKIRTCYGESNYFPLKNSSRRNIEC
jgi:hypothetical protein